MKTDGDDVDLSEFEYWTIGDLKAELTKRRRAEALMAWEARSRAEALSWEAAARVNVVLNAIWAKEAQP